MTIEEALDKLKASDKCIFREEVRVVCAQLRTVEVKAKPERCSEQNRNAKKILKIWVKVRENSF